MTRTRRRSLFALTLAAAAWTFAACGAPPAPVVRPPLGEPGGVYETTCTALRSEHARELAEKRYVPTGLLVHAWPGAVAADLGVVKSELDLVPGLLEPAPAGTQLRIALVLARGGAGKSKLAWSIAAQACAKVPVFRVDLATEIAPRVESEGKVALAYRIAREVGLATPETAEDVLKRALGDRPWLVIADSLDEVPLLQRQAVAAQLDDLVTRIAPKARVVVFTRPPVFTSNYGLQSVDVRVEIPQMSCAESDDAIAHTVAEGKDRKAFDEFVKRYRLDRQVTAYGRCYYPHLATWRDIQVVDRLVRNTVAVQGAEIAGFTAGRAQIYTYFMTAQLVRDMQGVEVLPADALAAVDRMVTAQNPENGERNLPFALHQCVAALPGIDTGVAQVTCERLLQSSLFRAGHEVGVWHFDNQSLGDLFLARWAATALDNGGRADCTRVTKLATMLESNEVAGFLVGQANGQQCLGMIAKELCHRGGFAQHVYEQLDQGLPTGMSRAILLRDAIEQLEGLPNDLCTTQLLEQLGQGLPEPPPREAPPPAPEPPAKKKVKGKAKTK
ncbi:MAG: hypothetical protein ACOYOB_03720 [Myxococcota bacterium]